MRKYFLSFFSLFLLVFFLFPFTAVHAQYGLDVTANKAGYKAGQTPYSITTTVINTALALVYIIFFILMLYAGIRWMTAQGNEEYVTKAKNILEAAIIGLVVISMAYGITNFVLSKLIINKSGDTDNTFNCNHICSDNVFNNPVCPDKNTRLCCAYNAFTNCYVNQGQSVETCYNDQNICMPADIVNQQSTTPPSNSND